MIQKIGCKHFGSITRQTGQRKNRTIHQKAFADWFQNWLVIANLYMIVAVEQELSDLKAAQKEQTAAMEREQQAMTEQVQALQKKLAVVSSTDMTVFKLHFEQVQESINKMLYCIKRIEDNGDTEGAAKLKNAMSVLLSNTVDLLR